MTNKKISLKELRVLRLNNFVKECEEVAPLANTLMHETFQGLMDSMEACTHTEWLRDAAHISGVLLALEKQLLELRILRKQA